MKIFFTLLFSILFLPSWSQKFSYKWAENDLDKKESIRPDFVFTKNDGNFIVVSLKVNADAGKQKIAINEYNGALKKVKSVSDVRFKNKAGEDIDIFHKIVPRDELQNRAIEYMKNHENGLLKLGTGTGKSIIALRC
jgi:predicted ribonuclease YlaK